MFADLSTPAPKTIQLTADGLAELEAELDELTNVKLPAVIDRVAKAREYGDLSENAEYHDAKAEQELVETRIDEIQSTIAQAEVVKETRSTTKIGIGSTVTVLVKGQKKPKVLEIVGEFQADPNDNKISSVSPIGKALINKKKGDVVIIEIPAGKVEYTVQNIA